MPERESRPNFSNADETLTMTLYFRTDPCPPGSLRAAGGAKYLDPTMSISVTTAILPLSILMLESSAPLLFFGRLYEPSRCAASGVLVVYRRITCWTISLKDGLSRASSTHKGLSSTEIGWMRLVGGEHNGGKRRRIPVEETKRGMGYENLPQKEPSNK